MRSSIVANPHAVVTPPFWGTKVITDIPLTQVVGFINKNALFKVQWGFKSGPLDSAAYAAHIKQDVEPILARLVRENSAQPVLKLCAVYGYFPAFSEGNDIVLFDPQDHTRQVARLSFPRQREKRQLCIADFIAPMGSEKVDVMAMQVVTVGQGASDFARDLFAADRYQDYLYWHGLNVETTEALAEYIHKRIRVELGFAKHEPRDMKELFKQKYHGSRYSFGYPACPCLEDQTVLLDLLDAERIGVRLSDEYQLWPEESTSAIVIYHEKAKYFTP